MKKPVSTLLIIIVGILVLPALFTFACGLLATFVAYLANPKMMLIVCVILGIVSLPGILIGFFARR